MIRLAIIYSRPGRLWRADSIRWRDNGALWWILANEMPLSVMRSVKSELLTLWKGQAAGWEYLLRMFLTSQISAIMLLLFRSLFYRNDDSVVFLGIDKTVNNIPLSHILAAHSSWSTTQITHAQSTNSGNAKMLMPTFARGCEVGLFKQWEVCKVKKGITHSHRASEVHTFVKQQK